MREGSSAASASAAEFQRLTVTVAPEFVERLTGELSELADRGWCEVAGSGGACVELWLPADDADAATRLVRELAARGVPAAVESAAQDDAWRDGLRRHHHPVEVGGRLRVRPPWVDPRPGWLDVVIDPGMAFGTGQHATTTGCLELLLIDPGDGLVDVGCGSGVLAIAACRLGYAPVWAIDLDPLAVDATIANARANGVDVDVALRGAEGELLPAAATVVANITARYVNAVPTSLPDPPPRCAVVSGFRPAEVEVVLRVWASHGYRQTHRIDRDDWTALRLVRP